MEPTQEPLSEEPYIGVCIGGPFAGKRVGERRSTFKVCVSPPLTMYRNDASTAIPVTWYEYRHNTMFSANSKYGYWLCSSPEIIDVVAELFRVYVKYYREKENA